jgi:molybdopterin-biosynthesis enzyme MoeA-like protein
MSDNVKQNLDTLQTVIQEIKFYRSKEENSALEKYSQKNDVLKRFESSLTDRLKDLEKQRESVESMRKLMEDQLQSNTNFFVEERTRLKEKQTFMDDLKQK